MNEMETACIASLRGRELEPGDRFYMKKLKPQFKPLFKPDPDFDKTFELPTPPPAPESKPQSPKGYDYLSKTFGLPPTQYLPDSEDCAAAVELIQYAVMGLADKTAELEKLKVTLAQKMHIENTMDFKQNLKAAFDLTWCECFGPEAFPTLKTHFKNRLGL